MKLKVIITLLICTGFISGAYSQKIPTQSTHSQVEQGFGLGKLKLEYSRPSANGRTIWGSLVPYGQVWRTGANYPTFLTFDDTTYIEAEKVSPGKYALYTIPSQDNWTIILSSNTKLWGAFGYTDSADVLRVNVPVKKTGFFETFTIYFSDIKDDEMNMNLQWGDVRAKINLKVDIIDRVVANLKEEFKKPGADLGLYWKGAEFLKRKNTQLDLALTWAIKATEGENSYWVNYWTVAEIYALKGDYKKAIEWGISALDIGRKSAPYFTYEGSYNEQINIWRKKL